MDAHETSTLESPLTEDQLPVRRRLGRGLNALLGGGGEPGPVEPAGDEPADLKFISVDIIERNPFQPRQDFDDEAIAELMNSIREHGVLQPLLVRPHATGYQLVAGERRLIAARKAGLTAVPCRVFDLEDRRVCEVAIEENLKRKDLNVLEKAQAFQDYLDRFGSSIEDLARQLSLNRSTVSNFLRLLELPDEVKQALRTDKISNGHARALLPLDDENRIAMCRQIQSGSWSVRKTEAAVKALQQPQSDDPNQPADPGTPSPEGMESPPNANITNHVLSLQDQLREHLGAKVEIRVGANDSGKIVIHFQSNDDFERILRQLRRAA